MAPRLVDTWHGAARGKRIRRECLRACSATFLACGVAAIAWVLAGHASPVCGQPAEEPATTPSGQIELARLVDLAAQRLKVNIEYDSAALKSAGAVTLRLDGGLNDQELWLLLNRTLALRGFTTVKPAPSSGYLVVKLAEAAGVAPLETAAALDPRSPGFQSVLVRAAHRPSKELAETLGKVLTKPGGSAVPLGDNGLILISDISSRIEQAMTLLLAIDVDPGTTTINEVPVSNLAAPALATLVAQVSAKRELVSGVKVPGEIIPSANGNAVLVIAPVDHVGYWRELIEQLDRRERVEAASYTPRSFSVREVGPLIEQTIKDTPGVPVDERWRVVTDDLTGTLIITATPSQHEQIRALIERLDSMPGAVQRPVRSFVIKNRSVNEIQSILERMISTGVIGNAAAPAGSDSGAPAPPPGLTPWPPPAAPPAGAGTATAPPARSAPKPRSGGAAPEPPALLLTVDEGTNTLIAMADPRVLAQIEALLKTLDVRQPQVMLEVLIVSLNDAQTLELGVELDKLITAGDTMIRLSSLFGLSARGPNLAPVYGTGTGFTGTVLDPGDFSAVIRALQTINKGRSLSMPRMLVTNNQQATLDSTLDQPYASTNASNTVTTTSYGGSQQAGTQVTLTPQITESDHLNLEYSVSLSAFTGAAANSNLPPPKQQNKVASAASIPDGYTVVVGGIELTTEGQGTSQVPGIGDIPILGEAFKNRSKTQSRTRFYVFIRASILRSRGYEDLKYLSDIAAKTAAVDDGWPEVEPRVIR